MLTKIGCCKICMFDIAGYKSVSLPCWHLFHSACLKEQMKTEEEFLCPTCYEPFTEKLHHQIRLSKTLRKNRYIPSLNPIMEEISTTVDPVSILECEFLYQTSYQYPPEMISKLSANMLITEAKIAAKSAHQFANTNPIKSFQEAILAQWMLKHVKHCNINGDTRMAAIYQEAQTNVSWIISRQKDVLKFFVQ